MRRAIARACPIQLRGTRLSSTSSAHGELELFTESTPNGHKVSIMLEEMGVAYKLNRVDLVNHDHKTDFYTGINPNQKIPTLLHRLPGGEQYPVFESGAILMYLADTFPEGRQFLPSTDQQHRFEVLQWLIWQMANLGPMQGQAVTFTRYAPEPIPFALDRYYSETKRLYGILEDKLGADGREFLVRDEYSIADIAIYPWVRGYRWALGFEFEDEFNAFYPNLRSWSKRLRNRPGVNAGLNVPPIEKDNTDTQKRLKRPRRVQEWWPHPDWLLNKSKTEHFALQNADSSYLGYVRELYQQLSSQLKQRHKACPIL